MLLAPLAWRNATHHVGAIGNHLLGMKALENAAEKPTWKTVWSAGQSVGLIDDVLSVREILAKMMREYSDAVAALPQVKP